MIAVTGATRLYAIVGDPIAQARSPAVYNALLREIGRDAALIPWRLTAEDFEAGMRGLRLARNLDGLVLTYPHKHAALALADFVNPRARQVGATNAMRRRADGGWEADMFDGVGLTRALSGAGLSPRGRDVWLIGAGGAGSAIAFALAEAGVRRLHVTDAEPGKARRLAKAVAAASPAVTTRAEAPALADVSLLINATPVGLAPGDGSPLAPPKAWPAGLIVVDIVPREETPLIALARAAGLATITGAAMVEGQAQAVLDFFARAG